MCRFNQSAIIVLIGTVLFCKNTSLVAYLVNRSLEKRTRGNIRIPYCGTRAVLSTGLDHVRFSWSTTCCFGFNLHQIASLINVLETVTHLLSNFIESYRFLSQFIRKIIFYAVPGKENFLKLIISLRNPSKYFSLTISIFANVQHAWSNHTPSCVTVTAITVATTFSCYIQSHSNDFSCSDFETLF